MRKRAVRMLFEHQHEYPSQRTGIESIAKKRRINHETLRIWVRKAALDGGRRPGVTTEEQSRIKGLGVRTGSCAGRTRS